MTIRILIENLYIVDGTIMKTEYCFSCGKELKDGENPPYCKSCREKYEYSKLKVDYYGDQDDW